MQEVSIGSSSSTTTMAKNVMDVLELLRKQAQGAGLTSDAGLLACRELDDALGLTETAEESRGGRNIQHRLVGLLRLRPWVLIVVGRHQSGRWTRPVCCRQQRT